MAYKYKIAKIAEGGDSPSAGGATRKFPTGNIIPQKGLGKVEPKPQYTISTTDTDESWFEVIDRHDARNGTTLRVLLNALMFYPDHDVTGEHPETISDKKRILHVIVDRLDETETLAAFEILRLLAFTERDQNLLHRDPGILI